MNSKNLNDLINLLTNDERLLRYKELEKIVNSNQTIRTTLDRAKYLQKQIINLRQINKQEALNETLKEYREVMQTITDYPLIVDYLELQEYFNALLQHITNAIQAEIITEK